MSDKPRIDQLVKAVYGDAASDVPQNIGQVFTDAATALREQAAEIERLRNRQTEMEKDACAFAERIAALEAENERLRANWEWDMRNGAEAISCQNGEILRLRRALYDIGRLAGYEPGEHEGRIYAIASQALARQRAQAEGEG